MIDENLLALLVDGISVLGLVFLFFWLYRDFAVDSFRQRMFALRDSLFDQAEEGLIAFDHPAYGLLRGTMNGYIRFAHRLSLFEMLLLLALARKHTDVLMGDYSFEKRWEAAVSELDPEAVTRLNGYRGAMQRLMLRHLLVGSPLPLLMSGLLTLMIIPVLVKQQIIAFIVKTFRRPLLDIESTAMAQGEG